eukprot:364110_1
MDSIHANNFESMGSRLFTNEETKIGCIKLYCCIKVPCLLEYLDAYTFDELTLHKSTYDDIIKRVVQELHNNNLVYLVQFLIDSYNLIIKVGNYIVGHLAICCNLDFLTVSHNSHYLPSNQCIYFIYCPKIKLHKTLYYNDNNIHFNSLSNNFLTCRQNLPITASSVIQWLLSIKQITHGKIRQSKLIHMLYFYGDYKTIIKICMFLESKNVYSMYYIYSIIALEQHRKLMLKSFRRKYLNNDFMIFLFVDCMNKNERNKYNQLMFDVFLYIYIRCVISNSRKIYAGYLMLFCSNNIYNELESISIRNLYYMMISMSKGIDVNENELLVNAKVLKTWTSKKIIKKAKEYLIFGFECFKYHLESNIDHIYLIRSTAIFHIIGKVQSLFLLKTDVPLFPNSNNYNPIVCFVKATCITAYLHKKILSLKGLMFHCYLAEEYSIGLKILNSLYKLCKGYIFPSFVNKKYFEYKKKFKRKINKMKCVYCNKQSYKLKSCKNCMKAFYCSRLCQKLHWTKHKSKCHNVWNHATFPAYSMLKSSIFDRL